MATAIAGQGGVGTEVQGLGGVEGRHAYFLLQADQQIRPQNYGLARGPGWGDGRCWIGNTC